MTHRRDDPSHDFLTPPTSEPSGAWEGLGAYEHTDEMPVALWHDVYDSGQWWRDKRARFEAREQRRQICIRHIAAARREGIIGNAGYDWLQIELSMDLLPDVYPADGSTNWRVSSEYDQRWYSSELWEARARVLLAKYEAAEQQNFLARQLALPVDHPDRVTLTVPTIDPFGSPPTPYGPGGLPAIPETLSEPWHRALLPPWSEAHDSEIAPRPQRRRTGQPVPTTNGPRATRPNLDEER